MALNIDLDGFGFLDSDSDVADSSKLSPTLNKPPVSPIESESSSGISSLDSDDLKKQLLSSPPTISHDQQSNDGNSEYFQNQNDEDEEDDGMDEQKDDDEDLEVEEDIEPVKDEPVKVQEEVIEVVQVVPVEVIYQNRNVLNLAGNVWNSGRFIQYTVLPENNLSCFFQNRAQYWRLGNSSGFERSDTLEKCSCCDFSYPSIHPQQLNQHGPSMAKNNAITDSLLTFLKNHHADNTNNAMPNHNKLQPPQPQRMYNNNAPYAAYQIIQNQYQQQQQQQQNNGYYNNTSNNNNNNNGMNGFNQQMNPFNNSNNGSSGYNNANGNSALALLNLMNQQTRNVTAAAAGAFQQAMNNNSRYYNNNMNTNNGYGLYKQF